MATSSTLKFTKEKNREFSDTLKLRVQDYFKDNNISKNGNTKMYIKTIVMLLIYLTPYAFILSGTITSPLIYLGLWAIMGIGMSGIGFSIMHDAAHGAYSKSVKMNKILGNVMNLIGGYAENWRIQHNVFHHTYTNVEGMDEDIDPDDFLRFSPHAELRKVHRYQHYYAWFLYGLMTFTWVAWKDFTDLKRYYDMGMIKSEEKYKSFRTKLFFWKALYILYIIVLPIAFSSVPFYYSIIGFFVMQYITGMTLAIIFQLAHVVPPTEFPLPDENGQFSDNWEVHQLKTTANFAPKNYLISWFVGGLNYQVEHHLFPNVCHVHYPALSKIVQKTAEEYGVPYNTSPTFISAVLGHAKTLKKLGTFQPEEPQTLAKSA